MQGAGMISLTAPDPSPKARASGPFAFPAQLIVGDGPTATKAPLKLPSILKPSSEGFSIPERRR